MNSLRNVFQNVCRSDTCPAIVFDTFFCEMNIMLSAGYEKPERKYGRVVELTLTAAY